MYIKIVVICRISHQNLPLVSYIKNKHNMLEFSCEKLIAMTGFEPTVTTPNQSDYSYLFLTS